MTEPSVSGNLPRTKFQCVFCREIFWKRDVNEKKHMSLCIANSEQEEQDFNTTVERVRKRLKQNSCDGVDSYESMQYSQEPQEAIRRVEQARDEYDPGFDIDDSYPMDENDSGAGSNDGNNMLNEDIANAGTDSNDHDDGTADKDQYSDAIPTYDYAADKYSYSNCNNADLTSKQLYELAIQHKVSRAFFNNMTKVFNAYVSGMNSPLLSYYKSKNLLQNEYPVKAVSYDTCIKGCMMYEQSDALTHCLSCKRPRFTNKRNRDGSLRSQATMVQLSLAAHLASLVHNTATREDLSYRQRLPERTTGTYTDVFDGDVYTTLKDEGLFAGDLDVALALYTDGFTVKGKQLTIVHLVILNLPPSIRYETRNMIQVCVIPGPRQPKNIFSFLKPLLDDLQVLQTTGIRVKADDSKMYHIRAHLLLSTGDSPAACKVMCHGGHSGSYGCRLCEIKGAPVKNERGRRRGMYFVPRRYPKHKTRSLYSLQARSLCSLKRGTNCKGLTGSTPFASLKSFKGASFFGLDIMHLMGPGIGKQFWNLVCGKKYGVKGNPLYLKPAIRCKIGRAIAQSSTTIPSTFSSCTLDISHQAGTLKSIDWIDFMRYVVPTIVLEHIKDDDAKEATYSLSQVCSIVFQPVIKESDIRRLDRNVWKWLSFLQVNVENGNIKGTVFTITQHYLQHLTKMIRAMGPPCYYAAFAMERAIGEIKHKVRSPSAPGINAGNVMVELAAQRYVERIENTANSDPVKEKTVLTESTRANAIEIWSPLWHGKVQGYSEFNLEHLLEKFWSIYLKKVRRINPVIDAGARLWISEKEVIGSSYRQRNSSRRNDFYVKMTVDVHNRSCATRTRSEKLYFGEAVFYFRHTQQGRTKLLALVNVWNVLLDDKKQPYVQPNGESKLCVLSAGDIRSMVGIYTAQSNRRYLVWQEKKLLRKEDLGSINSLDC